MTVSCQSTPFQVASLLNDSQRIIPMSSRILKSWRVSASLKTKRVSVVDPPRRVVLTKKLTEELDRLQSHGIMKIVTEATP